VVAPADPKRHLHSSFRNLPQKENSKINSKNRPFQRSVLCLLIEND